uniref:Uncharacterized protein n=1 Tax=viral metagenome TaxID=1070528 RepID=A0A6H2A0N3_9ZZZZ
MACKALWTHISSLDSALNTLRRAGIPTGSEAYQALLGERGKAFGQLGRIVGTTVSPTAAVRLGISLMLPVGLGRAVSVVSRLFGFSPGELTVLFDVETGWVSSYSPGPTLPTIVRSITQAQAELVLRGDPPPELVHLLETPDPYIGE